MSSGSSDNSSSVLEEKNSLFNKNNIKIGLIIAFGVVVIVVSVVLIVNIDKSSKVSTQKSSKLSNQNTSKVSKEENKPVDCVVNWSDWSECDSNGSQTKTGIITTEPSNGGNPCPSLTEQQACTPPPIWSTFPIGQSINCYDGDPQGVNTGGVNGGGSTIYRYMGNNTANAYPSNIIAFSWDSFAMFPKTIDCTGLQQGPDMKYNPDSIIQYDGVTEMAVALAPAGLYYYLYQHLHMRLVTWVRVICLRILYIAEV